MLGIDMRISHPHVPLCYIASAYIIKTHGKNDLYNGQRSRLPCCSGQRRDTSLMRLPSSDLYVLCSAKSRNAYVSCKNSRPANSNAISTAPPTFAGFHNCGCQSLGNRFTR